MKKYRKIIATVISIILFLIISSFLILETYSTRMLLGMLNILICVGIWFLISEGELRFFSIRKDDDFSTKDGFRIEIYILGFKIPDWLDWLAWIFGTFAIFIMVQLVDYIVFISGSEFFYILLFILTLVIIGGISEILKSAQSSYREQCDKLNESRNNFSKQL